MKNIAIVCGGYSGEYDISVSSAKVVANNLDVRLYNSFLIVITKSSWHYQDANGHRTEINKNDFTLELEKGNPIKFDGVFNAIHGTPGEDGKLLGYFDMLNIRYTSCSADVSALTFNKYLCNKFVSAFNIKMARSVSFTAGQQIDEKTIVETLGMPLFVKPACSGSSVGITKVKEPTLLRKAIEKALEADTRVIIEEFIEGREIACGLIKNRNELIVFPLTEIVSKNEFFDYEAKYTKGMADEITPPVNLNSKAEIDIKTTSAFLYNKFDCKGFVRIDYIVSTDGIYFIEINTVPGISEASILPQQAEAMGLSISKLFSMAVENMFL